MPWIGTNQASASFKECRSLTYRTITTGNRHSYTSKWLPPWIVRRQTPCQGFTISVANGAKRRTTITLDDLPQGRLLGEADVREEEDEDPKYSTVVQQARNNMLKFKSCVVLTRVGGFYELYLDQAEKYGPLLNLKVADKRTRVGAPSVAMAGFPFFQLDRFLKTLVQDLDLNVAISEEFRNDALGKSKSGGLLCDRRVTRVVTPGTLITEKFIDPCSNNYLLAIMPANSPSKNPKGQEDPMDRSPEVANSDQKFGLAWVDLSTGQFNTQIITRGSLPSAIVRIGASEVLMPSMQNNILHKHVSQVVQERHGRLTLEEAPIKPNVISDWNSVLEQPVPSEDLSAFTEEEVAAVGLLLKYVKESLFDSGLKLQPPRRMVEMENMKIDKHSARGLEILETLRDAIPGGKGSLLHTLRKTVTSGGARLLKQRLSSPSTCIGEIQERLDLVQQLIFDEVLHEDLLNILRRTYDLQRLLQKFSLGKGNADDLVSLNKTIIGTRDIVNLIRDIDNSGKQPGYATSLSNFGASFYYDEPLELAEHIAEAIDEDGLMASHRSEDNESAKVISMSQDVLRSEGSEEDMQSLPRIIRSNVAKGLIDQTPEDEDIWIMRSTASPILRDLHDELLQLRQSKVKLAQDLRDTAKTPTLTLKWTPGLEHVGHIKGTKDVRMFQQTMPNLRSVGSTKSTSTFYIPEWTQLGKALDQVKLRIRAEEQQVFKKLRNEVIANLVKLRRNATLLDELDVACSSALVAREHGFVRPVLNNGVTHTIIGGRHPTVTVGLEEQGRSFVSNDCIVGEEHRVWLITGPNMAGKSTFLRQNALISILAQIGSFVPADYAEIGIVDQIFSRIGSADNLYEDQSTFMVEMLETAEILRNATSRSFVIMDEVGRGTTPEDGVAIGYACLWHLYNVNQCRTLFATHFHALADMTATWEALGCYCTDVLEEEGGRGAFSYVHRLQAGVNRKSHALKVARIAGLPRAAISVAKEVMYEQRVPSLHRSILL
ncbi:DNA mismatch repair ATPase msh1 [Agyrium rufum]|nr:DNA mismatch repair ATPase msh1 [Agyrium rufum]